MDKTRNAILINNAVRSFEVANKQLEKIGERNGGWFTNDEAEQAAQTTALIGIGYALLSIAESLPNTAYFRRTH